MKNIPIVLITDKSQVTPCTVVIYSALKNASPKAAYHFYIFSKPALPEAAQEKLRQTISGFPNAKLDFIVVQENWSNVQKTHSYVTIESAYKMLISKYLTQYDKVLYLDTDVLVRDDLTELYDFEMEDNYLAGVVGALNYLVYKDVVCRQAGMTDLSCYINAGVMLMNLKAIRENKIDEKCISLLGTCEGSVDQHIFNKVCYGKIDFLPPKYNLMYSDLPLYRDGKMECFYCRKEIAKAYDNPVIFHWTGPHKPWKYDDVFLAHEWFRYYLKTPYGNEPLFREKMQVPVQEQPLKMKKKRYLFGLIKKKTQGNKRTLRILGIKFTYKKGKK